MKKRTNRTLIIILLVMVILSAALLAGMIWFLMTHFFVGGSAYRNDIQFLDLRDKSLSTAEYQEIRKHLPDCEIRWNVPFQGSTVPNDTTQLSVRSLSDSDLNMLSWFPKLEAVDATGCRDYDQLTALGERYPNIALTYTVVIGGKEYPQDTSSVTSAELTDEDIAMMQRLPRLRAVDATGCREYERIALLAQAVPGVDISYQVEMLGQTFTEETVAATFADPDIDVLMKELAYVTHLENVHMVEPSAPVEDLLMLMEAYPGIHFSWDKTVMGRTFNSDETEYDLTGFSLIEGKKPGWAWETDVAETVGLTETVEEIMEYFPNAEKVIVPAYNLDNKTMSDFREKMRPDYKVVWTVYVTKKPIRTDATVIHSSALEVCFIDEQSYDLQYCEDAVVVDIGHSYVKYIEWVRYMPNLKYLILADNWIKDLTPISDCKSLIYLELFDNKHIPDYSPLLGCTALQDLNISETFADLEPLKEMTWLNNLWANRRTMSQKEYDDLKAALPNTNVMARGGSHNSGGWRDLQNYFDMRDIMGLPYNKW